MQKNRLFRRFFCKIWSECGDSNPGPPAPKAGALPTAQHPDMKLWDCPGVSSQSKRATNCATPGYEIFQLWSNMWSTPIFDQLPAVGKVLSAQVSQGFPGFPRTVARTRAVEHCSRLSILPKYPAKSREGCSPRSGASHPPDPAGARKRDPAGRARVQAAVFRRQTLTPAAAMANTNQKMHMTRG